MRQIHHQDSQRVPELASFADTCPCLHLVQHDLDQADPGMLGRQPPARFASQSIFPLLLLPYSVTAASTDGGCRCCADDADQKLLPDVC